LVTRDIQSILKDFFFRGSPKTHCLAQQIPVHTEQEQPESNRTFSSIGKSTPSHSVSPAKSAICGYDSPKSPQKAPRSSHLAKEYLFKWTHTRCHQRVRIPQLLPINPASFVTT